MKRNLVLAALLALVVSAWAQNPNSNPPEGTFSHVNFPLLVSLPPIQHATVQRVGNPGNATYYYWIVANHTFGATSPTGPFIALNAPSPLTSTNYIQVLPNYGDGGPGVTVDLLRTSTPNPPSGTGNFAVATGVTSGAINDQGSALSSYTVNPVSPDQYNLCLSNQVEGAATAHLILDMGPIGNCTIFVADLSAGGGGGGGINDLLGSGPITVTPNPCVSGTCTVGISNSGVAPGTYNFASITVTQYGTIQSASSNAIYYQTIEGNSTALPQEPFLNLISGTNFTFTCVDDPGTTSTNCTGAASGGGGGSVGPGTIGTISEFGPTTTSIQNSPILDLGSGGLQATVPITGLVNWLTGTTTGGELFAGGTSSTYSPVLAYIGSIPYSQILAASTTGLGYCAFQGNTSQGAITCRASQTATEGTSTLTLSADVNGAGQNTWTLLDSIGNAIYGVGTGQSGKPAGVNLSSPTDIDFYIGTYLGAYPPVMGLNVNGLALLSGTLTLPMTGTTCLGQISGVVTAQSGPCGSLSVNTTPISAANLQTAAQIAFAASGSNINASIVASSVTNADLANSSITLTPATGQGLGGFGTLSLGGSLVNLELRQDCALSQVLQWNGSGWPCTSAGIVDRAVTGATDTILSSDSGNVVGYTGSAAVAISLPTPITLGNANFFTEVWNQTSGSGTALTITPVSPNTVSYCSGCSTSSSLTVAQGQTALIVPDGQTANNWVLLRHEQAVSAGTNMTALRTQTGITLSTPGVVSTIQALTGCNTSGYVLTPAGSDCVAVSGMVWPPGSTAGFPEYTGSSAWGSSVFPPQGTDTYLLTVEGTSFHSVYAGMPWGFDVNGGATLVGISGSPLQLGIPGTSSATPLPQYGVLQIYNVAGGLGNANSYASITVAGTGGNGAVYNDVLPQASIDFAGTNVAQTFSALQTFGSGDFAASLTGLLYGNGTSAVTAATAHNVATPRACADTSGSGTAQSCTTSPSFTPAAGDEIIYTTTTANSGTGLTINVNSLGAKSVAKWQTTTTLAANDIRANTEILMKYDGTNWEIDAVGNAPSGGGSSGGTNTYTSSQSASASDNGMLVVMNCLAPCAYTLPNPQPSTTFHTRVQSVGSTNATIALGSSMTYNGGSGVPVLAQYGQVDVYANTQTSTDYQGSLPLAAGSGTSIATSPTAQTITATGSGSGPCNAHYYPSSLPLSDSISTATTFATTISVPTTCIGVGSRLIVRGHGTYTNTSTASPLIAFAVGAGGNSTICPGTSHTTSPSLSQTASIWTLECTIQINTTGAPGTAVAWGNVEWTNSTGTSGATVIVPFNNNSNGTVNFTTSSAETVSIQETATPVSGQSYNLTALDVEVQQ